MGMTGTDGDGGAPPAGKATLRDPTPPAAAIPRPISNLLQQHARIGELDEAKELGGALLRKTRFRLHFSHEKWRTTYYRQAVRIRKRPPGEQTVRIERSGAVTGVHCGFSVAKKYQRPRTRPLVS